MNSYVHKGTLTGLHDILAWGKNQAKNNTGDDAPIFYKGFGLLFERKQGVLTR